MILPAIGSPELTFLDAGGKNIVVKPEDQARLIKKIEEIVTSANFNSRTHPGIFSNAAEADYWRPLEVMPAGSCIVLRYSETREFETIGGTMCAREVWLDLRTQAGPRRQAVYPGPVTLVDAKGPIRLTKESGYLLLGLGLDPAVFPHLPTVIQETVSKGRAAYDEYATRD